MPGIRRKAARKTRTWLSGFARTIMFELAQEETIFKRYAPLNNIKDSTPEYLRLELVAMIS